jgi:hypothetical protein
MGEIGYKKGPILLFWGARKGVKKRYDLLAEAL